MKLRLLFLIILLATHFIGFAKSTLSMEESAILRQFFRALTEESEAGYVFFNKKPICIDGYFYRDVFAINSPAHKQSVALRAGASIWKQLPIKNSGIIVHICDKEDPGIPGYLHVLVINVPLFHRTVNDNLSLFQYVLGPAVTSNKLLDALISNNKSFHSLLKDDKVLVGEILGFGLKNSLYVRRMEDIQEEFQKELPPFLSNEYIIQEYEQEYLPFKPSFGFKSAIEELNDFQEKLTLSSEKLTQNNPEFIFGWLKDSKKTEKFVSELEITQEKIQRLLSSTHFEKVLEKFTGKKFHVSNNLKFKFHFARDKISKVVAKGLWGAIQDYDFEFLPYFIEGMQKSESQHFKIDRLAWFPEYRRCFLEGKVNLEKAETFFQLLDKNSDYQCIKRRNLYFKIINNGHGEVNCNSPLVSLNYTIFSPLGHCLASQNKVSINLKNTIPGFAHGIKGMKIGETREIFIHPKLAYGLGSSSEKCMYLKTIVTLLDIQESRGSIPDIQSFDLSFLMDPKTIKMRDDNYKNALLEKGLEVAMHLEKCREIDLKLIREQLLNFYTGKESCSSTTQEEQDLINQVHWNIYFGEK